MVKCDIRGVITSGVWCISPAHLHHPHPHHPHPSHFPSEQDALRWQSPRPDSRTGGHAPLPLLGNATPLPGDGQRGSPWHWTVHRSLETPAGGRLGGGREGGGRREEGGRREGGGRGEGGGREGGGREGGRERGGKEGGREGGEKTDIIFTKNFKIQQKFFLGQSFTNTNFSF